MFVVKYHRRGYKTKYLGDKKLVANKRCALAFGEDLRDKFKQVETELCTLETIKVSDIAETMYADKYVKVGKINW